ncbi:MAG: hypothetical protein M1840_007053 [Geoglossum simile]|nr:MAG: hypothetical protein M1840_007053 [Geoglossum simile]
MSFLGSGADAGSDESDTDNGTPMPAKGSISSQKSPPKLGEGPSYDPTLNGVVPAFIPVSMPTSLTQFEIGVIQSSVTAARPVATRAGPRPRPRLSGGLSGLSIVVRVRGRWVERLIPQNERWA